MIRLTIIPIALALSGCALDKLDDLSKPTPAQQAMVERQALFSKPAVLTEVDLTPPECTGDEWRVYRCIDGKRKDWWAL